MSAITINLPDESVQRLHDRARQAGTSPEEFLRAGVEEWLSRPHGDFAEAAEFILNKNAELYRRLAR